MVSPRLVSFQQSINALKASLIVTGKDYDQYLPADHHMALGFRVLASAHLEEFLENRCDETAGKAAQLHLRGRPTRASKCLVVWCAVSTSHAIPLDTMEFVHRDKIESALTHYKKCTKKNHGINGKKLRGLLIPLGFSENEIDGHSQLFDLLDSIADNRNRAAHEIVNRAKGINEPVTEWLKIKELFPLLEAFDDSLEKINI